MNITYLMRYIFRQLHTIVRRYTMQLQLLETVCERLDFADPLHQIQKPCISCCTAPQTCPLSYGQTIPRSLTLPPLLETKFTWPDRYF